MRKHRALGVACMLTVVFGTSALAASLPGGASTLQETYQDWTVSCQTQKDVPICAIRQEQSNPQNGQRVLTAELRNGASGKVEGVILLPFGLDLAKGVSVKIDDTVGPNLTFSSCFPQGCLAPVSFDAKQIAAIKAGTNLNVTTTALSPSQPVAFKISLKGFGSALDRITALTK
ncbi:invasion associated locus B family protein [Ochrobactrum sp. GPK 3]|uniref:invasion associated locus B family protein n=1 Tax=Brucella sp. 22210 TaxID=3453892 RepID=UPI00313857CC